MLGFRKLPKGELPLWPRTEIWLLPVAFYWKIQMASWQSSMDCIQDELHKSWNASHDVLKIFTRNYDVSVWLRPSVVAMKSLRPGFSLENCGNLVDFVHQGLPQEEDVQNIQKRGRNGEAFKPSTSPPFIDISGWHRAIELPDSALPLATRGSKFQKTWRCFIQVVEIQTLRSWFVIIIPLGKVFSEQFLVSQASERFQPGALHSVVTGCYGHLYQSIPDAAVYQRGFQLSDKHKKALQRLEKQRQGEMQTSLGCGEVVKNASWQVKFQNLLVPGGWWILKRTSSWSARRLIPDSKLWWLHEGACVSCCAGSQALQGNVPWCLAVCLSLWSLRLLRKWRCILYNGSAASHILQSVRLFWNLQMVFCAEEWLPEICGRTVQRCWLQKGGQSEVLMNM